MSFGNLGLMFLGCYIAPFVLGAAMAAKQIELDLIVSVAGIFVTALLARSLSE